MSHNKKPDDLFTILGQAHTEAVTEEHASRLRGKLQAIAVIVIVIALVVLCGGA